MPVIEVKVLPVGTDHPSMSSYVRDCYEVARSSPDVEVTLTPTSTVIEGDWEAVWPVVEAMHHVPFENGVERVVTTVTIDDRRDKELDMDEMVAAVLEDEDG